MNLLKYIILGIIQGLTEPLPISSSGHLLIFRELFNTDMFNDFNFEIIVNFGSFLAILFIFRKDVIKIIKDFFSFIFTKKEEKAKKEKTKPGFKYAINILIGSIPVMITGFLFKNILESKLNNVRIIGLALLITALALVLVSKLKGQKEDKDITYLDALLIGLFQALTIMPGISRSGTVLVACLLRGLKREVALKYTFMLYFPVSLGSMVLGVNDLIGSTSLSSVMLPYTLGMIASLVVTYFTYNWFSTAVKKGKLWKFAIYCVLVGIAVLIYFR